MKITLDAKNLALYKSVITTFDLNDKAEYKDGKIFIDGKAITEYTFKQDYYFMMGITDMNLMIRDIGDLYLQTIL